MRPFIIAVIAVACSLAVALIARGQELPPVDLFPGAEMIAVESSVLPGGMTLLATYATANDAARVGVQVRTVADPTLQWGRITTENAVDNVALGIVPAWKTPVGFDRAAFLDATGCADARLVSTDTPRADVETNELGYFIDYLLPAEDNPITGEIALCLTEAGHIVQVASFGPTGGDALAPVDELTAAVVAWLADAGEPEPTPDAGCDGDEDDGEFRPMIVVDC